MKLPKNMLLPVAVIAEQPEILVCFALGILFLRRIDDLFLTRMNVSFITSS